MLVFMLFMYFAVAGLSVWQGITGAFRPGVLTALMGASGAGKTTLMDVLADRKTGLLKQPYGTYMHVCLQHTVMLSPGFVHHECKSVHLLLIR